jgi:uncharacterized protein YcgI (DUF1989 family)
VASQPGVEEILIPAGHGRAFPAGPGDHIEVVDVEGKQVADFIALSAGRSDSWLSPTHTRAGTFRWKLRVADQLLSNWREPMFEIVRDDVGVHDLTVAMCDERRYRLDYGLSDHRSCRSILAEALAGRIVGDWQIPDPVNLFQNSPIHPDGTIDLREPISKPGDAIVLAVLAHVIVGISACPQDQNACNGFNPTPILARVRRA